jgi:hypothetical protein
MYNIISSGEPGFLHDSIQFGRSRRLGGIIIPRHNYAAKAASFFFPMAILWNGLLLSVREERSVGKFRGKVSFVHRADSKQLIFLIQKNSLSITVFVQEQRSSERQTQKAIPSTLYFIFRLMIIRYYCIFFSATVLKQNPEVLVFSVN